jgi:hypothetical protein
MDTSDAGNTILINILTDSLLILRPTMIPIIILHTDDISSIGALGNLFANANTEAKASDPSNAGNGNFSFLKMK